MVNRGELDIERLADDVKTVTSELKQWGSATGLQCFARIEAALGLVKRGADEERCACGELKSSHTPDAGCIKLFTRRGAR